MSVEEITKQINELTVLELVELKDKLQEEWGVEAVAPVAVAVAGVGATEGDAAEEQDVFTVKIESIGEGKIHVIKAVRELTSLGLKEAKELVESAPNAIVAEEVTKEEADTITAKLEDAGATVVRE